MLRKLLALTTACVFAATALAQAPLTRIRGKIATLEGQVLTVDTREGTKVDVTLGNPLSVFTVKPVPLTDVRPGTYVGIASRTGANGHAEALEVLVFPEAMRGAGEGHYSWDLEPGSMMTNGNITAAVAAKSGRDLTLTYKGGTTDIDVPPGAPIVTLAPAERSDLKPGAPVMLGAAKAADGKLTASRVTVGTNGVAPPM